MLTGAAERSNEGAISSSVSSVKAIIVVSLMALSMICVVSCALSADFMLTVEPPPSLPFEFRIFSSRLNIIASSRLPTTFTWGRYNFEVYIGRRPRPMLTPIRDHSSLSAGGQTIEALTSVAYSPPSPSRYSVLFSWLRRRGNSPALALTDGMEPGQCWAFCGDTGQLGIKLTHAIRVSHLTVGYQSKSSTTSAPKGIILWGLKPADSELCVTSGGVREVGVPAPDFGSGYCGIRLLSGIYELSDSTNFQNFTTSVINNWNHYFDRMIIQIVGNWGNADFTCIYRIQIYGTA